MKLIALLVEGKTEEIFFSNLLPFVQLPDRLFVSRDLIKILDNATHENKLWLQDCHGDNSIISFLKKNSNAFLRNNFDKIILIRDYFPVCRPPTNLCKADFCTNLLRNVPAAIAARYANAIFVNLSVEEVEAWFFADKHMWERMNPNLTEDYINTHYDNILTINPESIRHPSARLKNIIKREIPNHRYNKTEKELRYLISKIDIGTCLREMDTDYLQSLNRIISYLIEIL